MRRLCTLALVFGWVCLAALGMPTAAAKDKPTDEVVVDHLNNPTGVLVEPDGTIWVAESGVPGSTKATARNFDIGKDGGHCADRRFCQRATGRSKRQAHQSRTVTRC